MGRIGNNLRIVSVQPHLRYGGSERQSVLLANELSQRGVDNVVVEFSSGGGLEQLLDPRVELISLGMESHLLLPVVAQRLYLALRGMPPSLVILKLWSALLAGFMIENRLPQHRFVYTEDLDPSTHSQYTRLGTFKQKLIKNIFTHRREITANTYAVRDSMVQVYGLSNMPQVISSAVDFEMLDQVDERAESTPHYEFIASAPAGVLKVVSVGSLISRKGLDVTKEALQSAGLPVKWLIIGEGPLMSEIEHWSTGQLEVRALGGLPRPFDVVRHCDLLVHSAKSEAFGIVVLEALGVGTPVISSETIGGTEIASTLGSDARFLQTYPVGDVQVLRQLVAGRKDVAMDDVTVGDFRRYIEPYSLKHTADAWVEYAQRALSLPKP